MLLSPRTPDNSYNFWSIYRLCVDLMIYFVLFSTAKEHYYSHFMDKETETLREF